MKILHITNQWPLNRHPTSGIFIIRLYQNLVKYGNFEYDIFYAHKLYNKEYNIKQNIEFYYNKKKFLYLKPKYGIYLPAFGISKYQGLNGFLAKIFLVKSILKIIKNENIKLIHVHSALIEGNIALSIKKKIGIPYVIHIHGGDVQKYNYYDNIYKKIIYNVYFNSNGIICNSTKAKKLIKNILGNYEKLINVIPFGIDINDTKKKFSINRKYYSIITVCHLRPPKNVNLLIKAVHKLNYKYNINLIIIGEGKEKPRLVELVKKLKRENKIFFLGHKNNEYVLNELPKHDLFVLPSIEESFGMVYLEALASGLPSIGTKGEGCEDIAKVTKAMLLVEKNDLDDLIKKIENLIVNRKNIIELGLKGINDVMKNYNWKDIVNKYENFYLKVLKGIN